MDQSINANHKAAQNSASSIKEPSTASTSSVDTTTLYTNEESGISIEACEKATFPIVAAMLGKGLDLRQSILLRILEDKWNRRTQSRPKQSGKPHPQTPSELQLLLYLDRPERSTGECEEDVHPWGVTLPSLQFPTGPCFRAWDHRSQSQILNYKQGFLSGASDSLLFDYASRQAALKDHADHGNRRKTPFISVTPSIHEIAWRVNKLKQKRRHKSHGGFNIKVSLINPYARLQSGMPMLKMSDELRYYGLQCIMNESKRPYYVNEILMPFHIAPEEIIITYTWRTIEATMKDERISLEQWYKRHAMADFRKHEEDRKAGKKPQSINICSPGESINSFRALDQVSNEDRTREAGTEMNGDSNNDDHARKRQRIEASNEGNAAT